MAYHRCLGQLEGSVSGRGWQVTSPSLEKYPYTGHLMITGFVAM